MTDKLKEYNVIYVESATSSMLTNYRLVAVVADAAARLNLPVVDERQYLEAIRSSLASQFDPWLHVDFYDPVDGIIDSIENCDSFCLMVHIPQNTPFHSEGIH